MELDKFCFLARREELELVLLDSMFDPSWVLPVVSASAEYSREKEISSLTISIKCVFSESTKAI